MNINFEKNYKIILLLIISLGLGLRAADINKALIWQDEAETVINSIQVIEDGYPNGYFKGKVTFESKPQIKIDDPIYEYASSNYYGSKYENNKGWLTYYYLAPFIKIFGVSETSVRLPFFIFFIFTIIIIFRLADLFFKNKKIALLACFLFAIDPIAILYGKQARYYSIVMLLGPAVFYLNQLYLNTKKNVYLFWLTTLLILSFHTHIILFTFLSIFCFYYDIIKIKKIKIDRPLVFHLLYLLAFTIPWLFLVKFWVNFYTHNDTQSADGAIKFMWLVGIFISFGFTKIFRKLISKKNKATIINALPDPLLTFMMSFLMLMPLLIPAESIADRVFIPILFIFYIIISNITINIHKKYKHTLLLILIMTASTYYFLFTSLKHLMFYGENAWIEDVFKYTQETNLDKKDDLLLTNWHDLTMALYSDYNIYPIATLNANFVNNYPNRVVVVFAYNHMLGDFAISSPEFQKNPEILKNLDTWLEDEYLNKFGPRLKTCEQIFINDTTMILDCPPK